MKHFARSYKLFLVLFLTGCELLTGLQDTGGLVAGVSAGELTLVNTSSRTLYYFVMEAGLAIRANWAACTDPGHCPRIAARQRVTSAYESIGGYTTDATTAFAYWWYLEKKLDGSYKPDSIRAVIVDLRAGRR